MFWKNLINLKCTFDSEDLMSSGLVPCGRRNSLLYSLWHLNSIKILHTSFLGTISLPVDWLAATHLLVLGMDQELVVHSLHHDLLGGVLAHIKPQLQLLWAAILALFSDYIAFLLKPETIMYLLYEGRPQPLEPGGVAAHGARDPRQEVRLPRHLPDIENTVI